MALLESLLLSLILFLLASEYTVWAEWGDTYSSGLELTRGHHALKQKYHLPLTPPINFVFWLKFKSKIVST